MDLPFTDGDAQSAFADHELTVPPLGIGGFKVVYRGRCGASDAVIKILKQPIDTAEGERNVLPDRFARELKAMELVRSPHVVTILEPPSIRKIGESEYLWYMEPHYPGPTLKESLRLGGPSVEAAGQVLHDILVAVEALWTSGRIVHRDIKPANIIWNGDGSLVLLDLGIALHSEMSPLTQSAHPSPSTPLYSAPEQHEIRRVAPIDFRTDLFQIGIVAAEAILGIHPFWTAGMSLGDYFENVENFDSERLVLAGAPKWMAAMITRLLAPRPAGRFRSVESALKIVRKYQ